MTSVIGELLEWSKDRPLWQRDALRRSFTGLEITDTVIDELKELYKLPHGLAKDIEVAPFAAEHVAPQKAAVNDATVDGIMPHWGVGALAVKRTIKFGPNLTGSTSAAPGVLLERDVADHAVADETPVSEPADWKNQLDSPDNMSASNTLAEIVE